MARPKGKNVPVAPDIHALLARDKREKFVPIETSVDAILRKALRARLRRANLRKRGAK